MKVRYEGGVIKIVPETLVEADIIRGMQNDRTLVNVLSGGNDADSATMATWWEIREGSK